MNFSTNYIQGLQNENKDYDPILSKDLVPAARIYNILCSKVNG